MRLRGSQRRLKDGRRFQKIEGIQSSIDRAEAGEMKQKRFDEMNNSELFSVLTGGHGPMAQLYLRQVILSYRRSHNGKNASLEEMVKNSGLAETA
jgi:hypothetical protein